MIFVTGGTGLLGSHLLFELTRTGATVKALKRSESNTRQVEAIFRFYGDLSLAQYNTIQWCNGDILDYFSLTDALEGVDTIYHAAAMVSFYSPQHQKMWEINVEGTQNILNAAIEKKVNVFCHVSSIATLGNGINGTPITEENLWQADEHHSEYASSKFRAEMEVWRASKEGLNTLIVNPSVIIGPGAANSSTSKIIRLVNSGLPFYTNGKTGYVDARDVALAMIALVEKKAFGERFILSAENKSTLEMMKIMASELNTKAPTIQANQTILWWGMMVNRLYSLLTGSEPILTRESIRSTMGKAQYSSEKFTTQFNWTFTPITKAVANAIAFYNPRNLLPQ